jgi:O-antigen/teichoic acid export membrane protein
MKMRDCLKALTGSKYRYVGVTTVVSLLAFSRNILFMKTLDIASLGQIALLQTVIMLVGFTHAGVLNGAYIQYSERDPATNREIVDAVTTGFIYLLLIILVLAAALSLTGFDRSFLWPETSIIGVIAGVATIASTWLNNTMVADGLLGRSNMINVVAVSLSIAIAFFSKGNGLVWALFSILTQPLAVALAAIATNKKLRPQRLEMRAGLMQELFRLGLVPFLSGLLVLSMHQIERWSIAAVLGTEALGRFYPVLMYATFFTLVPSALLNVFFPQARRAFATQRADLLTQLVRRHLRDLFIYFALAALITYLLVPAAMARFLPPLGRSSALVYYAVPGLVLFSLRDSASLVLFSSGRMQPLLIAGLMTLVAFSFGLVSISLMGRFSLVSVLIMRAVATFPGTIYLFIAQRRQLRAARCF